MRCVTQPETGFAQVRTRRGVIRRGRAREDVLQGRWRVLGFFRNKEEAVWLELQDSGG